MRSSRFNFVAAAILAAAVSARAADPPAVPIPFLRGDADASGGVDLSDAVLVLQAFFMGTERPGCDDAADVNDDGRMSVTDPIYLLRYLFFGGAGPRDPAGACGLDLTEDNLGCLAFAPCVIEIPCVDDAAINEALAGAIAAEFCIPAGIIEIPSDTLSLSVCPADKAAAECGVLQQPGCPISLTSISGSLDVPGKRIVIHIEGKIVDLPIQVKESLLGTDTTCLADFHGAQADAPFAFDVVVPLTLEEVPDGWTISGVGNGSIENVDMRLSASGGLVCLLLQAGQDALIGPLMELLGTALGALTAQLPADLQGLKVCKGQ
jgi:hypothetical protein